MKNKLKLVQLMQEDELLTNVNPLAAAGHVLDSLLNPYHFTKPVKGPVVSYLTYKEDSAKTFSDERNSGSLKIYAKRALENIPAGHLDSKVDSFWEKCNFHELIRIFSTNKQISRLGLKEVSEIIDFYKNIENNINRAKVEATYVPEAGELVKGVLESHSKANKLSDYVKGKIDYDALNLELGKIYSGFDK